MGRGIDQKNEDNEQPRGAALSLILAGMEDGY
jgi:hypothetical protein